ncbi:hypothetical protein [Streptomyces profundus]|nr:hypothetical protein [Streptomyces sp. MA3_2.13]
MIRFRRFAIGAALTTALLVGVAGTAQADHFISGGGTSQSGD